MGSKLQINDVDEEIVEISLSWLTREKLSTYTTGLAAGFMVSVFEETAPIVGRR